MFSPKLSKITRFCFLQIKIFLGEDPQTPFILNGYQRTIIDQDFIIYKSCATPPPPPRIESPFASEIRSIENVVPLNIHSILPLAFFFFCFSMSDPSF